MSLWRHLPNARHINRVIASLKEHPQIWAESLTCTNAAWSVARDAARVAVWDATMKAAQDAAWDVAHNVALSVAQDAARSAAWSVAYDAILALFVYDDCDQYLSMTSEELQVWALVTEHPAAVLLLPAVIVFERIKELESV